MSLYHNFYIAYYNELKEYFLSNYSDELGINESNFYETVCQPTNILPELQEIRLFTEINIPEHFKRFYSCYTTFESLQIPHSSIHLATPNISNQLTLKSFMEVNKNLIDLGLIPFGLYQDEWLICLNTNDKSNPNNPPISLFELSIWDSPEIAISPKYWFSSFDKFIMCFTDYIINKNFENFNFIDSNNNYKSAYPYWADSQI
jgi:hypothetical protein